MLDLIILILIALDTSCQLFSNHSVLYIVFYKTYKYIAFLGPQFELNIIIKVASLINKVISLFQFAFP